MAEHVSLYVPSFDGYADVWPIFFARLFKYWPECPYPIRLGAVRTVYDDPRVVTLHAEDHKNWSSRALEHLRQIDSTYVLMMLEDFMLDRPVANAEIAKLIELMDRFDLHAIRLYPEPPPTLAMPGVPVIGYQGYGQLNRTSTHATLWRRASLIEVIRPGESLWEFEINASIRSNRFPGGICGCWHPVLHYVMAIGKGRWFRKALRSLARDGIHPDLSVRPVETVAEEVRAAAAAMMGRVIRAVVSLHWRQRLQSKINPNAYRY